ncbi:hypothetical protein M405DRAFT_806819 [Rhizopogon salebrosus TDB-379]|nr:hypothetical protein M405DRAFT_806819 [Rhizopogon salebrosus TDB-379]
MADGRFADGTVQSFYFPEGHEHAGAFKGMAEILKERGFDGTGKLRAGCCCRRLLYNQPDFVDIKSNLELACGIRGYEGYAKRMYRQFSPNSSEAVLEQNMLKALDAVPLTSMRKFATRSLQFMDAYHKGYRGHRTLPLSLFENPNTLN